MICSASTTAATSCREISVSCTVTTASVLSARGSREIRLPVTFANGAIGPAGAVLGALLGGGAGGVPGAAQAAISIGNKMTARRTLPLSARSLQARNTEIFKVRAARSSTPLRIRGCSAHDHAGGWVCPARTPLCRVRDGSRPSVRDEVDRRQTSR